MPQPQQRKAHYTGSDHFVVGIPRRVALSLVAKEVCADQREDHAIAQYTPRSGCPTHSGLSGRTYLYGHRR